MRARVVVPCADDVGCGARKKTVSSAILVDLLKIIEALRLHFIASSKILAVRVLRAEGFSNLNLTLFTPSFNGE